MSENASLQPLWYVIHTYSGYENKVATNIEKIVENRKLGDYILDVKIPTEKVTEVKDDKKREVERKVFPGYVLVKMVMNDDLRYIVRNVRGVTGFVGSVTDPIPLTDQEVEALNVDSSVRVETTIHEGDYVQINDDGFTAPGGGMWTGIVKSVDAAGNTAKVAVEMFGNETVLEVDLNKLEAF